MSNITLIQYLKRISEEVKNLEVHITSDDGTNVPWRYKYLSIKTYITGEGVQIETINGSVHTLIPELEVLDLAFFTKKKPSGKGRIDISVVNPERSL